MVRLDVRCGNMEEDNKYWLNENERLCVYCKEGKDNIEHFVSVCNTTRDWFVELGDRVEDRTKRIRKDELDEVKGRILRKL